MSLAQRVLESCAVPDDARGRCTRRTVSLDVPAETGGEMKQVRLVDLAVANDFMK